MGYGDSAKLQGACNKVENYIVSKSLSLGVVFSVMDTDSSKGITYDEFRQKTKMLRIGLDDDEITALFRSLDINHDGTITYQEFVEKFAKVNT